MREMVATRVPMGSAVPNSRPASPSIRRPLLGAWLVAALVCLCAASPLDAGTYHTVKQGQTLASVARTYNVTTSELASANRLPAGARLTPGSKLYVPTKTTTRTAPSANALAARPPSPSPPASRAAAPAPRSSLGAPQSVTVKPGESLWSIAKAHRVEVADLAKSNGLKSNASLKVGQTLRLPVKGGAVRPASEVASTAKSPATPSRETASVPGGGTSKPGVVATSTSRAGFQWPVQGKILRRFEKSTTTKHFGIDIGVPRNTPIRAARDGTVVYAGDSISAYGRMVVVDHGGGWASCYAYNSRLLVSINDRVKRGEVIAESGDSGRGDQPFVHFQLRRSGDAVDPLPYLP